MILRGVSVNEVEQAVKAGAKELQLPNKILYHFRYFTVVARKVGEDHFIITVKPRG